jgi:glutamate dehydrogenase (NADP+)
MPCTTDAVDVFHDAKILFGIGKAANAGGVAVSGLEMSQNSLRFYWDTEKVDGRLRGIMDEIHEQCVQYGTEEDGFIDYVKGANIAGFVKVADAMLAQGVV